MKLFKNFKLKIKNLYRWLTATRLRKFLSGTLSVLIVLTSIRYLFLSPKEALASDIYLAMDEGYGTSSAVRDSNATVSAGSITNAVWRAEEFCKSGKCLYFDGTGDYVSFTDDTNLDFTATNTFTIEGWFRTPDITSGTRVLVAKHNATAGGYKVYMDSSGYLIFGIDDDLTWGPADTASTSTTAFDDNKWHFFSAVKNGTTSISLYVDGVLYQTDSSLTETGSLVNADTFYLGIDGDGTSNGYSGFLDEVKVLRTARTQAQIITDYLSGNTSITGAGPVGWWRMDESSWTNNCSTDTVFDSSGNGNNGDSCPNTTGPTGGASGVYGNAGSFDGTDDKILASNTGISTGNSSYSWSAWVYHTGSGIEKFLSWGDNTTNQAVLAGIESGFVVVDHWGDDWTSTCAMPTNTWTHLAGTYSAGTETIYKNGAYCDRKTGVATLNIISGAGNIVIGDILEDAASEEFTGRLDDVKVYNYARSATQILEDMVANPPSGVSASFGPDTSYLSNGLVGYWPMDETAANTCTGGINDSCDKSGNSGDGAWGGNTTSSAGKFGNSTTLDGTGDYIQVANNSALQITQTITLSAWIYSTDQQNNYGHIIVKNAADTWTGPYGYYRFWLSSGEVLNFEIGNDSDGLTCCGDEETLNGTASISLNTWYHVVATYDRQYLRIYINGQLDSSKQLLDFTMGSSTHPLHIGINDDTGTEDFDGKIDETRIYNRALSPAEVAKLYNFAPGPVGHWKMDENTGTTANDISGNGLAGSWSGTTGSQWQAGKLGSAGQFNGTNNDVKVADNSLLDFTGGFTLGAWVNFNDLSTQKIFIGHEEYSTNGYVLGVSEGSAGEVYFRISYGGNSWISSGTYLITTNQWYYIVGTYDGTNMRLYIDGILRAGPSASSASVASPAPFCIGAYSDGGGSTCSSFRVPGKIDDVKVYNYARTQAQIIEDMNGGHPSPGSPIGSAVAYWNFDEGYGTTAYDSNASTGGTEDLTLSAASWTNSGKFGKAWDGTGARWLSRADDSDLDFAAGESFTISGWFKHSAASAVEAIFQKLESTGTDGGYRIQMEADGDITCETDDDDADTTIDDTATTTAATYDDGAWHHVACVYDTTNTDLLIYIDSVLTASDTSTTTNSLANDDTLYVGDSNGVDGGDEFNGDLDEFRVYRSALSADQVKVEYNNSSAQTLGVLSTDSTGASSNSDLDAYCPPGQGSTCTAPVAHWKMDENTGQTVRDSSTNQLDGFLGDSSSVETIDPAWTSGKFGSGLSFSNPDGDEVSIGTSNTLNITGNLTVEAWFNTNTLSTSQWIFNRSSWQVGGYTLWWRGFDTKIIWETNTTGSQNQAGWNYTPPLNTWVHLAVSHSGSTATLYINGISQGTNSIVSPDSCNLCEARISLNDAWAMSGKLDDVRIYNYARTPAQVAWDYNRGAPVGHWQMDETSWNGTAGEVKDASGNANHGVRVGNATTTTGKINNGGTFDNLGDYVSVTNATPLEITGDLTISAWVKRNSSAAQDTIVDMALDGETEATNHLYHLYFDSSGFLNLIWEYGAGSNQTTQSSVAVSTPTGSWSHIAVTRNVTTNEVKYYENGIQLGSTQSFTNDPTGGTTANLILGAAGSTLADWPFDGLIDDVRLYNYVATPQQIKTVMNDNSAVRFAPVTGAP